MVTRVSDCQPELLQNLIDDQLSRGEQESVTDHLEQCEMCRDALETLAAEDQWWSDASSFLGPDDVAGDSLTRSSARDAVSGDVIVSPLSTVESSIGNVPLDFLEPSDSPAMLGRLGDYDIIEPIGCGGMGVVLKGYDAKLNRFVAVKVLAPHYATSAAARKRFAREAQAAAAVVHPHVLAIHSVDATGRLPFLVMPCLDGESLQERIRRNGPLGLAETLRIGAQAARGLQAAHEQGLVHRDIKPGNILLERGVERAVLTDFGLARAVDDASMTRSGVIAGTPQFMSPEQARGDAVDHRSDLFSLGSVLYTMCAGRPPFRSETTMGLLRRIVEDQPRSVLEVNSECPVWLAAIVERLHAKRADERFESAGELAELLERCLAHVQQPTVMPLPDSLPTRVAQQTRRRSPRLAAAGIVFVLIGVAVFLSSQPPIGREAADRNDSGSGHFTSEIKSGAADAMGGIQTAPSDQAEQMPRLSMPESQDSALAWDSDIDFELQAIGIALEQLEEEVTIDSLPQDTSVASPPNDSDQE